jgi:hypothetical protein
LKQSSQDSIFAVVGVERYITRAHIRIVLSILWRMIQ